MCRRPFPLLRDPPSCPASVRHARMQGVDVSIGGIRFDSIRFDGTRLEQGNKWEQRERERERESHKDKSTDKMRRRGKWEPHLDALVYLGKLRHPRLWLWHPWNRAAVFALLLPLPLVPPLGHALGLGLLRDVPRLIPTRKCGGAEAVRRNRKSSDSQRVAAHHASENPPFSSFSCCCCRCPANTQCKLVFVPSPPEGD